MSWWSGIRRWVRLNYLRVLRQKSSPHAIALGAAIGIFVGFLPIIPFQTGTALALAFIFRASKLPSVLFTWISNPVNMVPFYAMLFFVGKFLVPVSNLAFNPKHLTLAEMIAQGWHVVAVMVVGSLVLGIPGALLTYFFTRRAVAGYRKRKAIRLLRKRASLLDR